MPRKRAEERESSGRKRTAEAPVASRRARAEEAPSGSSSVQGFIDDFNKKMRNKDGTQRAQIMRASDYELPYYTKRLPTGLLTLDLALGGGFPAGGLSQIAGPKNSGKSWITWQVIRQQQFYRGEKMRALLAMTEMRADRDQARKAGVKIALGKVEIEGLEKARLANGKPPFSAEEKRDLMTEVGEIHELHAESAETFYDGILEAVRSDSYDVIVIDSFGSILTAAEAESETLEEGQSRGGSSKINSEFLRRLNALLTMSYKDPETKEMKTRDVCVLGINQVRDNMNTSTSKWQPYITTGGRALEHAKFIDLWVFSSSPEFIEDPLRGKVQTGKEVRWEITKGKAGIHEGARGRYFFDFSINTADFYDDMITAAAQCGVIHTAGAWIGIPDPTNPSTYLVREQGRAAFVAKVVADVNEKTAAGVPEDSYFNKIRSEVLKRHNIDVLYDW